MQKLAEYKYNSVKFKIIKNYKDEYDDYYIVLRIYNDGDIAQTISLCDTRYISMQFGILKVKIEPKDLDFSQGWSIIPGTFVDAKLKIEINEVLNLDKLELHLCENDVLLLQIINKEWFVVDASNYEQFVKELGSLVEQFETIEESLGISLQNFSFQYSKTYNKFELFIDVISISDKSINSSFTIEVAVYDKRNKIIAMTSLSTNKFLGFEVFALRSLKVKDISDIGRIRIYPTKM